MPNPDDHIELDRQFAEISQKDVEQSDIEARVAWGMMSLPGWSDVLAQHRVVILSSAGTGKTWETHNRCRMLRADGKRAFFIRLEYLAPEWNNIIFEDFGDVASLKEAVANREEIWLFLDSVDEARLQGPQDLEKALKRLEPRIRDNLQNTHIY